ncbi:TPA: SIR2 family protein [Enterococcus hirae]
MSNYSQYLISSFAKVRSILDDSGTRPILFVGSGISRRYIEAPDWENLLKIMIDLNPNMNMPIGYYTQQTNNDYPEIANILTEEYQKLAWEKKDENIFPEYLYDSKLKKDIFLKYKIAEYLNSLDNNFSVIDHPYQKELENLSKLNPHAIITTNYDRLIDKLFSSFKVIVGQQVIKKKDSTSIGHILKIHGSTDELNEIIISKEDYDFFNKKQKYLTAKLLTYFMEHPIFFFGYSITDQNIKNILADIAEIVSENSDQIVDNIWFVEWKQEPINENFAPPTDKTIDLGAGKSIRINYILLNSFEEIYESLYQPSIVELNELRDLQENIYNIVKSKTISNLEVDMVSIRSVNTLEKIEEFIGINSTVQEDTNHSTFLGLATITDPEQFLARFPLRLSEVAEKLGYNNWYHANVLIKQIEKEKHVDLKATNNNYHVDMGAKEQHQHRYSSEMVDLLFLVKENKDYTLNL